MVVSSFYHTYNIEVMIVELLSPSSLIPWYQQLSFWVQMWLFSFDLTFEKGEAAELMEHGDRRMMETITAVYPHELNCVVNGHLSFFMDSLCRPHPSSHSDQICPTNAADLHPTVTLTWHSVRLQYHMSDICLSVLRVRVRDKEGRCVRATETVRQRSTDCKTDREDAERRQRPCYVWTIRSLLIRDSWELPRGRRLPCVIYLCLSDTDLQYKQKLKCNCINTITVHLHKSYLNVGVMCYYRFVGKQLHVKN